MQYFRANCFMQFREIIAAYFDNHMKYWDTLWTKCRVLYLWWRWYIQLPLCFKWLTQHYRGNWKENCDSRISVSEIFKLLFWRKTMLIQLWCMACWGVMPCISVDMYQSLGRMLSLHLGGMRVNRQNSGTDNYDTVRGVL